ncbi:bifunctional protein-serine/threonine kinase/phosphatase [Hahella sp. HN01]|uniref:bifunctional protein-serine/threonine kinase/phosphatase n=1 Tax=Hahella sp. HN01 TaxID=2847262 RepID=UPI001C1ED65D|nr:bifunctional protein-serine/threonine kinase/phosphatase [Hahella sp. HN01]MBU6953265.1 protein kinase [Hahella sp. HN01]
MPLSIHQGSITAAGVKALNEDAVAVCVPSEERRLHSKGVVATLADGVSSAEAGKEASATAVDLFIADYLKTPDTWAVSHAGQKILSSLNLRLYRKSQEFVHEAKGYLCTFSALIIKSRTAHIFHVGDSRIYLLRHGELTRLTRDHIVSLGGGRKMLARAVGMDNNLPIDYGKTPLEIGDILILTSDGVHDFLNDDRIKDIVDHAPTAQEAVDELLQQSLHAGSNDNLSAIVLAVDDLPDTTLEDYSNQLTRLPFPPELEPGMTLDGLVVEKEIFASSRSQLYLVKDQDSGERWVMKTPSRNYLGDVSYIDRFIQEEWIGKRIENPHVVRIIEQPQPRTCLYYLMEHVEGITLQQWIKAHPFPKPKIAFALIEQIANGLSALHSQDTIHQDLKPANIIVSADNRATIIDFGSVYVAGVAEVFRPLEHVAALGTASYSDPLYLLGQNTGARGDLYALATIAYEMFTGELPYGDPINECRSRFDYDRLRYRSAMQFNPVIPLWFDRALQKGVAFDLDQRYQTMDALLQDLKNPNPAFLQDNPLEMEDRSPVMFWQMLSGFWALILLLVLILFSCQGPS